MFDVQSKVPITDGRGRRAIYPFRNLNVGDSFFVPADDQMRQQDILAGCGKQVYGKGCVKTSQRTEGGVKGVRVWRIA